MFYNGESLLKTLEINLPDNLYEFIQGLVDSKKIESVESFIIHAVMGLSELYGYGAKEDEKSLSNIIVEHIISKIGSQASGSIKKVETIVKERQIPNMSLIMEAFGASKFMYSDALYTACVFSRMKKGDPPLSTEEFNKSLEEMEEAGVLTKIEKDGKIMWKKN